MSAVNDFVWKGVSAASLGLCVLELPPVQAASRRDTPYIVPYRDGELHIQDGTRDETTKRVGGYLPYEQHVNVADIRHIASWLQGRGMVSFSDDPGREYDAYIVAGIDYNQWVNAFDDRVFEIYFACQPMAYHKNVADIQLIASGYTGWNPGLADARPLLEITGSGDVGISVQGHSFELDALDSETVYVDCRDMEAYGISGGARVSKNHKMTGEFPVIAPGAFAVSWTGTVKKIVITPRWCD